MLNTGRDGQRGLRPHGPARFEALAERGLGQARLPRQWRRFAAMHAVDHGTAKGVWKDGNGLVPICQVRIKHTPV
jgi:hypothetical protein